MLALEVIGIARAIRTVLEERNEHEGCIIAMSKKFGLEMAKQLAAEIQGYKTEDGAEPDSIAGMRVVYKEECQPALITAGGKAYPLLPDWAREELKSSVILRPTAH